MIRVEVRDEHLRQLRQADRGAQHLALRPLAAVEEQALAAAPDEQRRGSPLSRRDRARRPEEDEVEVHWRESRRRDQGLRPSIRSRGSRRSSVSTSASCTPASQKTLTNQRRGSGPRCSPGCCVLSRARTFQVRTLPASLPRNDHRTPRACIGPPKPSRVAAMAADIRELIRLEPTSEEYDAVRALWKRH